MSARTMPVVGGTTCRAQLLRLPLDLPALQEIALRGQGGLWYEIPDVEAGARFIDAWYGDGDVIVAMHAELRGTPLSRRFALVPVHHEFPVPKDVEVHPLRAVACPVIPGKPDLALFSLYEVRSICREGSN